MNYEVTRAVTMIEEGRPPRIALELTYLTPDGEQRRTFTLNPHIGFAVADALGRHAIRLEPKILDNLRERVAEPRAAENGEPL